MQTHRNGALLAGIALLVFLVASAPLAQANAGRGHLGFNTFRFDWRDKILCSVLKDHPGIRLPNGFELNKCKPPTTPPPPLPPLPQATSTLSVSTDASSPTYQTIAGGTTGITVAILKLHAQDENIDLQKIAFNLTHGAPGDLTQLYVYAGNNLVNTSSTSLSLGTLLGTFAFSGISTATSTLTTVARLQSGTDATLIIKADVANIGPSQPGTEGDLVNVDYLSAQGTGVSSSNTIIGAPLSGGGSMGIRIFKTIPHFALESSLPSTGLADGRLLEFKVTAESFGPVGVHKFTFNISTTSVNVTNVQLFVYTDSSYTTLVSGSIGAQTGEFGNAQVELPTGSIAVNTTTNPLEIPAGSTYYFKLVGTVSNMNASSSVISTVLGDMSFDGMKAANFVNGNFVWSPNASSSLSIFSTIDWTNGFGVSGLPANGLSKSRSN